jgi:hypothetical protein
MPRLLAEFPKRHPVRIQVARRLREARYAERQSHSIAVERDFDRYEEEAGGLVHFLRQVKQSRSQTLLEIGTGKGVAAQKLHTKVPHVITTGLIQYQREPDVLTSAELLRKIPDGSIGGILAIHSLSYSAHPKLAIRKLDRVLEEGGIIKAVFSEGKAVRRLSKTTIRSKQQSYKHYVQELIKLGYDVAVCTSPFGQSLPNILVAVKPGEHAVSAKELLERDLADYKDKHYSLYDY